MENKSTQGYSLKLHLTWIVLEQRVLGGRKSTEGTAVDASPFSHASPGTSFWSLSRAGYGLDIQADKVIKHLV